MMEKERGMQNELRSVFKGVIRNLKSMPCSVNYFDK